MEPGLAGLERAFESRSAVASGIVKSLQRRRRRLLHLNAALPMRRVGRQAQVDVFVRRTKRVDAHSCLQVWVDATPCPIGARRSRPEPETASRISDNTRAPQARCPRPLQILLPMRTPAVGTSSVWLPEGVLASLPPSERSLTASYAAMECSPFVPSWRSDAVLFSPLRSRPATTRTRRGPARQMATAERTQQPMASPRRRTNQLGKKSACAV